jgi:hypothetical protein
MRIQNQLIRRTGHPEGKQPMNALPLTPLKYSIRSF